MPEKKKKVRSIIRLIVIVLVGLVVLAWIGFNQALKPNHEKKFAKLQGSVPSALSKVASSQLGKVHFVTAGDPSNRKLLFVHGSPGSWDAWMRLLTDQDLLNHYFMISVDRPGYGKTTVPYQTGLKNQALAIKPILALFTDRFTLVGHSYGGAVIQQLALDYPDRIENLIYVAGTLEPAGQRPRWYNKVADTKLVSTLLSDVWNASSKEMIGLPESLQLNEPRLKDLRVPTYMIQGKKDVLVPFSVVDYYQNVTAPNPVTYLIEENENHFIPFTNPALIKNVLMEMKDE